MNEDGGGEGDTIYQCNEAENNGTTGKEQA